MLVCDTICFIFYSLLLLVLFGCIRVMEGGGWVGGWVGLGVYLVFGILNLSVAVVYNSCSLGRN